MFYPEEVIFAPASACNLVCKHCFAPHNNEALSIDSACTFLSSCLKANRSDLLVGFSGGEPFLCMDFICEVSAFACKNDFLFSRVVTNGIFGNSMLERELALERLFASGFDGKIALSFDSLHGQGAKEAAHFLLAAIGISSDTTVAEIWSVIPQNADASFFNVFQEAAAILELEVPIEAKDFMKPCRFLLRSDDIVIPVYRFYEALPPYKMSWDAKNWFQDDFCEGLGRCFFVHPDGSVAPCCGFANFYPKILIGTIDEGYATLMENAKISPGVSICQGEGISAFREKLEAEGIAFPGKASDQCAFCAYLFENGLFKQERDFRLEPKKARS